MLERRWKEKLVRELRGQGAYVLSKGGHAGDGPGWPDLWLAAPAWTGWLELKVVVGDREPKVAPRQRHVLGRMNAHGGAGTAFVLVRREYPDEVCFELQTHDGEVRARLYGTEGLVETLSGLRSESPCPTGDPSPNS